MLVVGQMGPGVCQKNKVPPVSSGPVSWPIVKFPIYRWFLINGIVGLWGDLQHVEPISGKGWREAGG